MAKKITLIIPCFNEEGNIKKLHNLISEEISRLKQYVFEILFIDDGSSDKTKSMIKTLADTDNRVSYIFFSRNFGKESAMMAGIADTDADAVILLDADLQDPPSLIRELIAEWEKGFCNVYAKRTSRKGESVFKRVTSWVFYKFLNKISDIPLNENVGDFRLLDRKCVDAFKRCQENQRYSKGLFEFIGFSKKEVEFIRDKRFKGKTKIPHNKRVKLGIQGVVSFSSLPLKIANKIGVGAILISLIFAMFIIIKKLFFGEPVLGFPALVTLIVFLSGTQLFTIGILSEYVNVIFHETKSRPPYIIEERSEK